MTSLADLIQKTRYQKLFEYQKSDVYLKALKAQERYTEQASLIFWMSCFIGLFGNTLLSRMFFPEHFLMAFLTIPLSAVLAAALQKIYYKSCADSLNFKEPIDLMAQYNKDFLQHATKLTSNSAQIIELFQAFEQDDTITHHFDLPKIFKDINQHLSDLIKYPKKHKMHQDAIVALITPIFSHYLEQSLIKNRLPSVLSEEEVETYQAVLRSKDSAYNRDFLCTSTNPSELIALTTLQSMSASRV